MFFYKIWRKYYPAAKEGLKFFVEKRKVFLIIESELKKLNVCLVKEK
jgi:hypothetical protein